MSIFPLNQCDAVAVSDMLAPVSNVSVVAPLREEAPASRMRFGRNLWERYFGTVGEAPALFEEIEQLLERPCPFWAGQKVRDTHVLVLVPTHVDGVPLTLRELERMANGPKEGHPVSFFELGAGVLDILKRQSRPLAQSKWLLMTKKTLPDSSMSCMSLGGRLAIFGQDVVEKYRLPTLLEASVCSIATYVHSGERLLGGDEHVHTLCEDQYDGSLIAAGDFQTDERIGHWHIGMPNFRHEGVGFAVVREL